LKSFLFSGLVVVFSVTACAQKKWTVLESKEGQFSVSMPGSPTETSRILNASFGEILAHFWILRLGDSAFSVVYSDYPEGYVREQGPKMVLDSSRDGAVEGTQGTLLTEFIVKLGSYPGREIKIAVANGEATSRDRFFLVGRRLYQLVVASPKAQSYSPDIGRFFESFKLLSAEKK
jgi:hypothetical protein